MSLREIDQHRHLRGLEARLRARAANTELAASHDKAAPAAARHRCPLDPMRSIKQTLHALREQRRRRRATLPWAELEAEAARQGCSPADIVFDRAGRRVPGLPIVGNTPAAPDPARGKRRVRAPAPRQPTFDIRSRRT